MYTIQISSFLNYLFLFTDDKLPPRVRIMLSFTWSLIHLMSEIGITLFNREFPMVRFTVMLSESNTSVLRIEK